MKRYANPASHDGSELNTLSAYGNRARTHRETKIDDRARRCWPTLRAKPKSQISSLSIFIYIVCGIHTIVLQKNKVSFKNCSPYSICTEHAYNNARLSPRISSFAYIVGWIKRRNKPKQVMNSHDMIIICMASDWVFWYVKDWMYYISTIHCDEKCAMNRRKMRVKCLISDARAWCFRWESGCARLIQRRINIPISRWLCAWSVRTQGQVRAMCIRSTRRWKLDLNRAASIYRCAAEAYTTFLNHFYVKRAHSSSHRRVIHRVAYSTMMMMIPVRRYLRRSCIPLASATTHIYIWSSYPPMCHTWCCAPTPLPHSLLRRRGITLAAHKISSSS